MVEPAGSAPCPDAFLLELNPTGTALTYSTYLGGNNFDLAFALAIDNGGDAFLGGETFSAGYTNGGATINGSLNLGVSNPNASDGFVAKINLSSSLVYFTYLGGSDTDTVSGITLDAGAPDVIVTGSTVSTDFPVTAGAFQTCIDVPPPNPGTCPNLTVSGDAFVTKLDSTGQVFPTNLIVYSTYLGGSDIDVGLGIVSDSSNNAYVTGNTSSTAAGTGLFPITERVSAHQRGHIPVIHSLRYQRQ